MQSKIKSAGTTFDEVKIAWAIQRIIKDLKRAPLCFVCQQMGVLIQFVYSALDEYPSTKEKVYPFVLANAKAHLTQ